MAVLMTPPYLEFQDADGQPLTGGKVFTYASGTSDPKAAFSDSSESVQLPNPIILDAAGRAVIWISGSYKFVITDALNNIIRTVDNVTSFNATAAASNSYFQSFSGNGSQTVFTLSEDLGTDENSIMVFVDAGGAGTVTNTPIFNNLTAAAAQTNYTLVGDFGTDEYAVMVFVNTTTKGYEVLKPTQYTVNGTSLTLVTAPTVTGADSVYIFKNPVLSSSVGKGFEIQNPNTYTLSGTSLSFITPPATGTNNVMVFAPSTLVNAAAASAAAAEGFADAANLSAVNAAASEVAAENAAIVASSQATSFVGTSVTSVTIGTGAKAFVTQAGKNFLVGEFLTIAYTSAPANYMWGQVTAYNSLTGDLSVNVTAIGGSGTQANWTIALSGERGVAGPAISDGDKGDVIVSGGGSVWTVDTTAVPAFTGDSGAGGSKGLVPSPAAGDAAAEKVLKASGGWGVPQPRAATEVAASGASIDFLNIPAGTRRITISLSGVSTNGTSNPLIQLGDSGGIENTGYACSGSGGAAANYTTGFGFNFNLAANALHGVIVLTLLSASGSVWSAGGWLATSNAAGVGVMGGSKQLSATLDRIRITTVSGADAYDAGFINILYE
ncbi:hypothetical protein LZG74_25525 [Dyadobacter sp. CY327]|uniref:hypothetical protein n=1 Tax=Dyadobacter sp. CY327 TaxID=2907301 RepID=UPI001F425BFB|nr:hypothetical protein [Dyadobacter sp. CY327]MCE7073696.1 hypothetical protein [Dyadobacter sp. CY327]